MTCGRLQDQHHLTFTVAQGFTCENGAVRIEDGATEYEGRVEVCINNKYTSVCDDGTWGAVEATVVCNQLNYTVEGSCEEPLASNEGVSCDLFLPPFLQLPLLYLVVGLPRESGSRT